MPSSTFSKYNCFVEDVGKKVHNLNGDTFYAALTNTAPNAATHTALSSITEIAAGNGYTAGGATCGVGTYAQTAGTAKFTLPTDPVWTASGGSIGPFRYVVLYNNTAAGKNLVGFYDYGSSITVNAGEPFTLDLDQVGGVFQLS